MNVWVYAKRSIPSPKGYFSLVDKGASGIILEDMRDKCFVEFDDYGILVRTWVKKEDLDLHD